MDTLHPLAQIAQISTAIKQFMKLGLATHDLTFNQYNLLQLLVQETHLRPSELADRLSINRPTTTVILRNLEKKGWIERSTDLENRRNVQVRITPSGLARAETARKWMIEVKGSFDPLVGLSESELETLQSMLSTIYESTIEHLEVLKSRLESD